jgi:hypothetical protein
LHLGIPTDVTLFVADAPVDLGGGVSLLGRRGFVIDEDLIDDRLDRPQLGGWSIPGQRLGMGVRMLESMPDDSSGVSELSGDLSDGRAIAPRPSNRAVVVHGHHVLGLRVGDRSV